MKLVKCVDIGSIDIDVEIDADDIVNALADNTTSNRMFVLRGLNDYGTFLNAISDAKIAELTDGQRKVVHDFMIKHAARFGG